MIYLKLTEDEYEKIKANNIQHQALSLAGLVYEWIEESEIPWRMENMWNEDFSDLSDDEFNEILDAIDNSDVVGDLAIAIDRVAYQKYYEIQSNKNEIQG